jgi:hypothetical protein
MTQQNSSESKQSSHKGAKLFCGACDHLVLARGVEKRNEKGAAGFMDRATKEQALSSEQVCAVGAWS